MTAIDGALAQLISRDRFTCSELAQALGVSRQAALKRLTVLLGLGQLVRDSDGKHARYYVPLRHPTVGLKPEFWMRLERAFPELARVSVASVVGLNPRTREQARRVAASVGGARWVVLDFAGTRRVGPIFLHELLNICPTTHGHVSQPINLPEAIHSDLLQLDFR